VFGQKYFLDFADVIYFVCS